MGKQTRRDFLRTVGSAAASAGLLSTLGGCANTERRAVAGKRCPNVVLVITDDQGYGDLACHGNPIISTPNLDKLHEQSVRLTDFHVSPTCSPTRAALMTGRYCNRTGVWHTIMGRSLLRADEVTMADVFSAAGYRTAIFGKWHLGDNYPFRPQDRGFDEALVHGDGVIGATSDYWGNDYFDDTYFRNGKPEKFSGYCTDVWFAEAMKFVETNRNKPFFLYLSTNTPHGPLHVSDKYSQPYRKMGLDDNVARFYGMITNIDENTGRLMRRLKQLGVEENTILIFMTDNGTATAHRVYNAGMRNNKGSEYDGGHRVPCFLRWPGGGLKPGMDVTRLTAHIDLLPTLIELCGLKKPPNVKFDGRSIAPLLGDAAAQWPERTLITDSQRVEHPQKWRKSAVMTDQWRLINGKELYDIKADPGQKSDVANTYPDIVARLKSDYERWWADTSERFDEYCGIIIGSDKENPSVLTSHDWHGEHVPWNQVHVRRGRRQNGFWAVDVAKAGRYEISLRRWPREIDTPITGSIEGGKAINITKARLKIGDFDHTQPVTNQAKAVTFTVRLQPGKTRLQGWFIDQQGSAFGSYYVYIRRLT